MNKYLKNGFLGLTIFLCNSISILYAASTSCWQPYHLTGSHTITTDNELGVLMAVSVSVNRGGSNGISIGCERYSYTVNPGGSFTCVTDKQVWWRSTSMFNYADGSFAIEYQ